MAALLLAARARGLRARSRCRGGLAHFPWLVQRGAYRASHLGPSRRLDAWDARSGRVSQPGVASRADVHRPSRRGAGWSRATPRRRPDHRARSSASGRCVARDGGGSGAARPPAWTNRGMANCRRRARRLCAVRRGGSMMIERSVQIVNKNGLHARPAAEVVKTAAKFKSEITIVRDDLEVNGKSIMGVMMLAAEFGATLTIRAHGPDAQQAVDAIAELIAQKFGEK